MPTEREKGWVVTPTVKAGPKMRLEARHSGQEREFTVESLSLTDVPDEADRQRTQVARLRRDFGFPCRPPTGSRRTNRPWSCSAMPMVCRSVPSASCGAEAKRTSGAPTSRQSWAPHCHPTLPASFSGSGSSSHPPPARWKRLPS